MVYLTAAGTVGGASSLRVGIGRVAIEDVEVAGVERIKNKRSRRCTVSLLLENRPRKKGMSPNKGTFSALLTVCKELYPPINRLSSRRTLASVLITPRRTVGMELGPDACTI
jgi:hypothetical protein